MVDNLPVFRFMPSSCFFWPIVLGDQEDGTVHNLDGYFQIRAKDAVTGTGVDLINAVFTQKLGVFATENQLEEFFFPDSLMSGDSLVSWT
ncbi:hypothetical protein EV1_014176 [Malus domestica]